MMVPRTSSVLADITAGIQWLAIRKTTSLTRTDGGLELLDSWEHSRTSKALEDITTAWQSPFPHTWEHDPREEPYTTFVYAYGAADDDEEPKEYGVYLGNPSLWMNLLSFIFLGFLVAGIPAFVLYHLIRKQLNNTIPMYVLGWGVFVPFWIFAPAYICNSLQIWNKIIRFFVCVTTPTVPLFRTMEAMYGFTPYYATSASFFRYWLYYSSPILMKYNAKTLQPVYYEKPIRAYLNHFIQMIVWGLVLSVYCSLFNILNEQQFPSLNSMFYFPSLGAGPQVLKDYPNFYQWNSAWDVSIWKTSVLYALLMQLCLMHTGHSGACIFILLTGGQQIHPPTDHPMLLSTSPADFWGRRWNRIVHDVLKKGVYKPVRANTGSAVLAALTAFVASALFHEWLLITVFFDYPSTHGGALLFFLWQGGLVAVERLIGHWSIFRWCNMLGPIRTILVICMGLPFAHWFQESYVRSDFFLQLQSFHISIQPIMATVTLETEDI